MSIITGSNILRYRLEVLLGGLKLELVGMKRHGRSMYAIIKDEFGLKGNKQKVYDQFKQMVQDVRDGIATP